MENRKTLSVVYTINDSEEFEKERLKLVENFGMSEDKPWAITAISAGHEHHRVSLLEEAHDANRHDLFDEIFGIVDPANIEGIEALDGY